MWEFFRFNSAPKLGQAHAPLVARVDFYYEIFIKCEALSGVTHKMLHKKGDIKFLCYLRGIKTVSAFIMQYFLCVIARYESGTLTSHFVRSSDPEITF